MNKIILLLIFITTVLTSCIDTPRTSITPISINYDSLQLIQKSKDSLKLIENRNLLNTDIVDVDFSNAKTIDELYSVLTLWETYSKSIEEGLKSNDNQTRKLAKILQNKLESKQKRDFPKLRKKYCEIFSNKVWEDNMYISISGNNSIINITNGLFASNSNIAESNRMLSDILTQFRFKEVRYRWYEGADEYTYYKLPSLNDNDLSIK